MNLIHQAEAARRLAIKPKNFSVLVNKGKCPPFVWIGKTRFFDPADVDAWKPVYERTIKRRFRRG